MARGLVNRSEGLWAAHGLYQGLARSQVSTGWAWPVLRSASRDILQLVQGMDTLSWSLPARVVCLVCDEVA